MKKIRTLIAVLVCVAMVCGVLPCMSVGAISASSSLEEFRVYALQNWTRPVRASYLSIPGTGRAFGASRTNGRLHAAVDYYVSNGHGTPVYAMTSGTVIEYSPNFYASTQAIGVQNDDGSVLRYCEIATSLGVGSRVTQGQQIGTIKANSSGGGTMLHLELYKGTASGSLSNTSNKTYDYVSGNFQRRRDLLNPEFLLALGDSPAPVAHNPEGVIDDCEGGLGTVLVRGWAFDRDDTAQSIDVHIYMDGRFIGSTTANLVRDDVNSAFGINGRHGYEATIYINEGGSHNVEVFGINIGDGTNTSIGTRSITITSDTEKPTITNAMVVSITQTGYTVSCDISDNINVARVTFPAWTSRGGQDDIVWHEGTISGNKAFCHINISDHNNEIGVYSTHVYAYDSVGNSTSTAVSNTYVGTDSFNVSAEKTVGDKKYILFDEQMKWENAKVYCEQLGGYLATITSEKEAEIIDELVKNGMLNRYYLGGTDRENEGNWQWVTGEKWDSAVADNHWMKEQPDNSYNGTNTPENFLEIYDGKWNDYISSNDGIGFICEIDLKKPVAEKVINNKKYLLFENENDFNWVACKAYCEHLGGYLATITSEEEQSIVEDLIANGSKRAYFLGGTDAESEGSWKWVTGEKFSYEYWLESQPDNNEGFENYLEIVRKDPAVSDTRNAWNDTGIYRSNIGFICEFDVPVAIYTVTFKNYDGTVLKTETVTEGESASAPEAPVREGYIFIGWDKEFSSITSDIIVTAQYNEDVKIIAVTGVTLNKTVLTLTEGDSETLTATIAPSDAANKSVRWISSDESVATVSNGKITAVKEGTATITVITADGGKSASCTVTVKSNIEPPKYSADVTVGTATTRGGETVTIPVSIANNPGIAGFNLTINYDKTKLTPLSIEKGNALTGGTLTSNIQQGGDMSAYDRVTAYWVNPADFTSNGEILKLTFKVAENADEGDIPVTVTYESGDVSNQNYEDVALNIKNGAVSVKNIIKGDVFADGIVNTKDGVRLSQYLAKWEVNLTHAELTAADVFADGTVNTKDGVKLSQYLAKWDVSLEKAETVATLAAESRNIKFEVGNVSAKAGEYVDVPIVITENTGVAGFNVVLEYDNSKLTPVSIEKRLADGTLTSNIQQGGDLSRFKNITAYWVNPSNVTHTGEAFVVRFKLNEGAEGKLPLTLTYEVGDICDQNYADLAVEIVNGSIEIAHKEAYPYTVNAITAQNVSGERVRVKANMTKNAACDGENVFVIAVYRDGVIADMLFMEATFAVGQTVSLGGTIEAKNGDVIKAFVWESLENIIPVSNTEIIQK